MKLVYLGLFKVIFIFSHDINHHNWGMFDIFFSRCLESQSKKLGEVGPPVGGLGLEHLDFNFGCFWVAATNFCCVTELKQSGFWPLAIRAEVTMRPPLASSFGCCLVFHWSHLKSNSWGESGKLAILQYRISVQRFLFATVKTVIFVVSCWHLKFYSTIFDNLILVESPAIFFWHPRSVLFNSSNFGQLSDIKSPFWFANFSSFTHKKRPF